MPLFQSVIYTTTGTKQSLNLDPSITPFNAVIACTVLTGPASYKMQYSVTPFTVADADANWFDSGDIPAATTTSAVSGLITPASRVRLVIATLTAGSITLEITQGFSSN
jgi:hypothetical protein